MSADDREFDDNDPDNGDPSSETDDRDADAADATGSPWRRFRAWLTARRGWVLLIGLSIAQATFAFIMLHLRSEAKPTAKIKPVAVRDLAVDMLGHEVRISQIDQLIPMRGGKNMMIGMDLVLVLGQLPVEQVEGSPRPSEAELALFTDAIALMEPAIRSRVNILLRQMPADDLGTVEARNALKKDVQDYVNDTLERLDFGKKLRKEIGKRRVTDVLVPAFIQEVG